MSEELKAAQARIGCLEGEIAKRDARIVELESAAESLRLSRDYHHEQENEYRRSLACLYAAPVSETKAHGVVMPDEREAFEKWGETLFFSACFERHGSDEYAGRGLQGAWLGWQARAALGGEQARLCVLPDGWKLVPNEPTLEMGWAYVDAANEATLGKRNSFNHSGYRAMLAVAPKAPTVESGLVEALTTVAQWKLPETGQFWPSGGLVSYEAQWGSNGARDYMRGVAQTALAAHSAKGVV